MCACVRACVCVFILHRPGGESEKERLLREREREIVERERDSLLTDRHIFYRSRRGRLTPYKLRERERERDIPCLQTDTFFTGREEGDRFLTN